MNLLLMSFLLSLLHLGSTEPGNFIVNIHESTSSQIEGTKFRCIATVIHKRFLLTTANCANVPSSSELGIERGIFESDSNSTAFQTPFVAIKKVYIHEEYDESKSRFANIALIETKLDINTTAIRPRTLGRLQTNTTCELFERSARSTSPNPTAVEIYNHTYCDPNFDQIFCTTLATLSDNRCSTFQSSPVVCNEGSIDGFLISDEACSITDNRYMIYYHSIEEFREWITDITGSGMKIQTSIILILSAVLITVKNFV